MAARRRSSRLSKKPKAAATPAPAPASATSLLAQAPILVTYSNTFPFDATNIEDCLFNNLELLDLARLGHCDRWFSKLALGSPRWKDAYVAYVAGGVVWSFALLPPRPPSPHTHTLC